MWTKTRLDKALESLACSKCLTEDVSSYRDKLMELAKETIDENQVIYLGRVYKGLADETRLRMVSLLKIREMCVCEVMASLNLTQPTTSHHLMILENAGVVKHRKEGKWVFYSISGDAFVQKLLQLGP